jgi:uncharacterized protein (TIGR02271 family)
LELIVFNMHSASQKEDDAPRRRGLPLDASMERWAGGWAIRLPVRVEHVSTEKQTVVAEEVTIRRGEVDDVVAVREPVRRERLVVDAEGDAPSPYATSSRRGYDQ